MAIEEAVNVEARFRMTDQASDKMRTMEGNADRLSRSLNGVLGQLLGLASAAGVGFGAAGMFSFAKSLVTVNQELESAQFNLGAVLFQSQKMGLMNGHFETFNDALVKSSALYKEMETHAARAVGTTEDYLSAWQALSLPVFKAGGGIAQVTELSKLLVPTAKQFGLNMETAGFSIKQALLGMVDARDMLVSMLNLSSDHINKLARQNPSAALQIILSAMRSNTEAMGAAGNLFEAKAATIEDAWKRLKRDLGGALFREIGSQMDRLAEWASKNQDAITKWANEFGGTIKDAFTKLVDASTWIKNNWNEIKETVLVIAEVYLAKKMAGAMSDLILMAGRYATLMRSAGMGGVGSAVGGAGLATGGAAALVGVVSFMAMEAMRLRAEGKVQEANHLERLAAVAPKIDAAASFLGNYDPARDAAHAMMGSMPRFNEYGMKPTAYDEMSFRNAAYTAEGTQILANLEAQRDALIQATQVSSAEADFLRAITPGLAGLSQLAAEKAKEAKFTPAKPPQVHVGKVEIKVDARHQDPDRVAASIVNHLGRAALKPIASRAQLANT